MSNLKNSINNSINNSKKSLCKSNIKKIKYNEAKQIVKNLNLSEKTVDLIANSMMNNKNIYNLPELNFVVNMLSNLKKKLGYTRNTPRTGQRQTQVHPNGISRKEQLEKLIRELDELKKQMINGNKMNKNKLKGLIDKIEKFYLGTRRKKNSTRDYFYQQLELLYKCQENNEGKFAKQLRKLLLNKKLAYSNIGQVFSPRSKNRKTQVMNFLQKNNGEILEMINNNGKIQKFYNNSKNNNYKQLYKNFKKSYKNFINKKGEKSNAELKKKAKQAQLQIQRANQSKQQIQQTEQSQQKQIQQPKQEDENYSLQSKEEENEEKKINQLISALNAFNKSAKIRGLTLQGLTSNKKKVRKELRDKLKEQVELLKKIKIGNQNENETLNKIMKKIQELFKKYNKNKDKGSKWTNGPKITTKRKNVNNLLQQTKPIQTVGGSMYVNVKGVGKRKLKYFTNGKKYVLVKGKKVSI